MQVSKRNSSHRPSECCQDCNCTGGFNKVLHVDTGPDIYLHGRKCFSYNESCLQAKTYSKDNTVILRNANQTELVKNNIILELNKYKTRCMTCNTIIHRVRDLLDEIRAIRRNETYVICEHCMSNEIKCKRCAYNLTKLQADQRKQLEERSERFNLWSYKVKLLLDTILKGQKLGYHREVVDAIELEKLLGELKPPAPRLPEIVPAWVENLRQCKDMLQGIILKLKLEGVRKRYCSDDSLSVSPLRIGCVCKSCKGDVSQGRNTEDLSKQILALKPPMKFESDEEYSKLKSKPSKEVKSEQEHLKLKYKSFEEVQSGKENLKLKSKPSKEDKSEQEHLKLKYKSFEEVQFGKENSKLKTKSSREVKSKKAKKECSVKDKEVVSELEKLLKQRKAEAGLKRAKKEKSIVSKKLKEFLKDNHQKPGKTFRKINVETSSITGDDTSDVTCNETTPRNCEEIIKGIKIVPLEERDKTTNSLICTYIDKINSCESSAAETPEKASTKKQKVIEKEQDCSGIIMYQLSERKFIENRWTQLPTMKVFRRMNIYKMVPSSPDWFLQHNDKDLMYYESGEMLAQIDTGEGKWFYKNGRVALECRDYNQGETLISKIFMVYSHGGDRTKAQSVLACFDYLGNGIVYDSCGNERLKYNQTEGIVIDDKIGPRSLWKWHTLNDPPILQELFIDTHLKNPSPELEEIIQKEENKKIDGEKTCHSHLHLHALDAKSKSPLRCASKLDGMLALELQNYAKEKCRKLSQKHQQFHIRMKTVKINDYFSLRVIDQSNVYLLFRDRAVTMKLNLGMMLKSDEIIDVDISEVNNVTTPYDYVPPKSKYFKRVNDAFRAARASIISRQTFPTKRPQVSNNIYSSTVCPLPPLSVPSTGLNCTLSPP